jgi:hypothetical protein
MLTREFETLPSTITRQSIQEQTEKATPQNYCLKPSCCRSAVEISTAAVIFLGGITCLLLGKLLHNDELFWTGIGLASLTGIFAITAFSQKACLASMTQHGLGATALRLLEANSSLNATNTSLSAQLNSRRETQLVFANI